MTLNDPQNHLLFLPRLSAARTTEYVFVSKVQALANLSASIVSRKVRGKVLGAIQIYRDFTVGQYATAHSFPEFCVVHGTNVFFPRLRWSKEKKKEATTRRERENFDDR
ncbi:hypothetical protein BaRGS_00026890 [Batillaria attramentaria]|uniref:Uncharacterized protein n=1 Tax=Batillaria attramentaria TaxID=370345 RepID=A0ABD0K3N0_9CAEN